MDNMKEDWRNWQRVRLQSGRSGVQVSHSPLFFFSTSRGGVGGVQVGDWDLEQRAGIGR